VTDVREQKQLKVFGSPEIRTCINMFILPFFSHSCTFIGLILIILLNVFRSINLGGREHVVFITSLISVNLHVNFINSFVLCKQVLG